MILGAVLAGGAARRFGSDKALALLDGRTLLDHVAIALADHVDRIAICGRRSHTYMSLPDRPSPDCGPLGGLAAALHFAAAEGFARVLAVPCDTPRIDCGMLAALASTPGPAFVADCPVLGIWPATLARALDRHLATADERSMRGWARASGATALDLPPPANVNRPRDLAILQR